MSEDPAAVSTQSSVVESIASGGDWSSDEEEDYGDYYAGQEECVYDGRWR